MVIPLGFGLLIFPKCRSCSEEPIAPFVLSIPDISEIIWYFSLVYLEADLNKDVSEGRLFMSKQQ